MKPDLNKFPTFTTNKFDGIISPYKKLEMTAISSGAWYDCEDDIICWFGDMPWQRLVFAVDHEILHRIIHSLIDLYTSRQLDQLYLFDLFGINKWGNESDDVPASVFDWREW